MRELFSTKQKVALCCIKFKPAINNDRLIDWNPYEDDFSRTDQRVWKPWWIRWFLWMWRNSKGKNDDLIRYFEVYYAGFINDLDSKRVLGLNVFSIFNLAEIPFTKSCSNLVFPQSQLHCIFFFSCILLVLLLIHSKYHSSLIWSMKKRVGICLLI